MSGETDEGGQAEKVRRLDEDALRMQTASCGGGLNILILSGSGLLSWAIAMGNRDCPRCDGGRKMPTSWPSPLASSRDLPPPVSVSHFLSPSPPPSLQ